MSLSSEQAATASYLPLVYPELSELLERERLAAEASATESAETEAPSEMPEVAASKKSATPGEPPAEPEPETEIATQPPAPTLEELVTARVEEERAQIQAAMRQELERQVAAARATVGHAIDNFQKQREEYFRKVESEVVGLALAVARRILHREAQMDRNLLAGLVAHELEQLEQATNTRIVVPPENASYWNEAVRELPCEVSILEDRTLSSGEVRLETDLGSVTVSIEQELKEVEKGFFDLLSHRPVLFSGESARVQ